MAKKSRGARIRTAKDRAAGTKGGKGPITKRKVGRRILKT